MHKYKATIRFAMAIFILLFASAASSFATTGSISTIYGTLNYTVTITTPKCIGPAPNHLTFVYTQFVYNDFTFTQGNTTSALSGSALRVLSPDGPGLTCPASSCTEPTLTGPNYTIVFDSCNATATVTEAGTTGYVDPKFMVVGVTYAPPGPSTSTYVQYLNTSFLGTTHSLSNSFAQSNTNSVSVSEGFSIAKVASGKITETYATTASQAASSTSTITTSFQVQDGAKTAGTGNYFAPVNHDYDVIYVWLNPAVIFTVYTGDPVPVWNGYGVDTTDQDGLDIVGIQLGYLNGDFGTIPPDIQASLNRSWATGQSFGSGDSAALTSSDFKLIAAADPFSASTYGSTEITSVPPSGTSDGRFTLSACSTDESFSYLQAAPSTNPSTYTCTLTYTNLTTQAESNTSTFNQTFSVDDSFTGGSWFAKFSLDLKDSYSLTWTTTSQSSITSSTTSTASLSVQGVPCGNTTPDEGPCSPVYDPNGNQPTQFEIYQDNQYGTFMFAPVHYY